MAPQDQQDQEPIDSARASEELQKQPSRRRSLASARRELSEKELATPAVQKLLIDEVERLEQELAEACRFRDKFYSADKEVGILQEKHKRVVSQEIISNGALATGSAALGFLPSFDSFSLAALCVAGLGVVLIGSGVWAKVVRL